MAQRQMAKYPYVCYQLWNLHDEDSCIYPDDTCLCKNCRHADINKTEREVNNKTIVIKHFNFQQDYYIGWTEKGSSLILNAWRIL